MGDDDDNKRPIYKRIVIDKLGPPWHCPRISVYVKMIPATSSCQLFLDVADVSNLCNVDKSIVLAQLRNVTLEDAFLSGLAPQPTRLFVTLKSRALREFMITFPTKITPPDIIQLEGLIMQKVRERDQPLRKTNTNVPVGAKPKARPTNGQLLFKPLQSEIAQALEANNDKLIARLQALGQVQTRALQNYEASPEFAERRDQLVQERVEEVWPQMQARLEALEAQKMREMEERLAARQEEFEDVLKEYKRRRLDEVDEDARRTGN